jgi:hypothetical protein
MVNKLPDKIIAEIKHRATIIANASCGFEGKHAVVVAEILYLKAIYKVNGKLPKEA